MNGTAQICAEWRCFFKQKRVIYIYFFFITVKVSSDTKGFFRELSKEVAREARNINIMKRDTDKSQQRPETPRHRGEMEYTHTHSCCIAVKTVHDKDRKSSTTKKEGKVSGEKVSF